MSELGGIPQSGWSETSLDRIGLDGPEATEQNSPAREDAQGPSLVTGASAPLPDSESSRAEPSGPEPSNQVQPNDTAADLAQAVATLDSGNGMNQEHSAMASPGGETQGGTAAQQAPQQPSPRPSLRAQLRENRSSRRASPRGESQTGTSASQNTSQPQRPVSSSGELGIKETLEDTPSHDTSPTEQSQIRPEVSQNVPSRRNSVSKPLPEKSQDTPANELSHQPAVSSQVQTRQESLQVMASQLRRRTSSRQSQTGEDAPQDTPANELARRLSASRQSQAQPEVSQDAPLRQNLAPNQSPAGPQDTPTIELARRLSSASRQSQNRPGTPQDPLTRRLSRRSSIARQSQSEPEASQDPAVNELARQPSASRQTPTRQEGISQEIELRRLSGSRQVQPGPGTAQVAPGTPLANTASATSSQSTYDGPTISYFAGKVLGEISNLLSEASSFLVLQETRNPASERKFQVDSQGTGFTGEALFTIGGLSLAGDAGMNFWKAYNTPQTPERREKLVKEAIEFVKGVANTLSGAAGMAGNDPHVDSIAGKISSGAWAFSEGANALMQGYEAYQRGKTLDKEQLVHLGQIAGSALKFAGIVVSLTPKSGIAAIGVEVAGSAASIATGFLNLYNKGHLHWLANKLTPSQPQPQAVEASSPV
jgi:hypothetical protein